MKLTKKLQAEIGKVYHAYWDAYLKGDMKAMASFLDDNYKVIGSSEGEVFFNKKEAIKYFKTTASQVAGKVEMRNRDIKMETINELVLITEQMDMFALSENEWTFYSKGRLTTMLHKKEDSWKIIQQHGSFPDGRADEGEQLALEKISKENLELRDAVKIRTVELEQKNGELKIEAALEKVRSRSLAMHHSNELKDVVKVVFEKLKELDFAIDGGAFILTPIENSKDINAWVDDDHAEYPSCFRTPFFESNPVMLDIWNAREAGMDFFSRTYSAEQKNPGLRYNFENTDYKILPDEFKSWILEQEFLTQSFAMAKNSAIGIHFHHQKILSDNEVDILKRFSKVFEQGYIRFLDLQKAEAQVKEAQIQLALERVRARTMAMHHSDEITDTVKLIYQEFDKLKISNESTDIEIGIIDEQTAIADMWAHFYLSDGTISKFKFPANHFPLVRDEFSKWKATPPEKRKELFFTNEFSGKVWEEFIELTNDLPELDEIFRPLKEAKITQWVTHNAYFSHGILTLQGTERYSQETLEIQKRLAKVFEQTYTRFLDLQKAEAQAREAKIEAALEKVRSRSLAMSNSNELSDVVTVVFNKLQELGILSYSDGVSIYTFSEASKDLDLWVTGDLASASRFKIPYTDHPIIADFWNARDNGKNFLARIYTVEEKNSFYKWAFEYSDFKYISEELKKLLLEGECFAFSYALAKNSGISINNTTGKLPSEKDTEILKRFGTVFEQTYTRFLDLQKAEAQAREAEIELAMERVRARTMAMQKSQELREVVAIIYEQLQQLGFTYGACAIVIMDSISDDTNWWMAGFGKENYPESYHIPFFNHPFYLAQLSNWKEGKKYAVMEVSGEEKKWYDEIIFSQTDFARISPEAKKVMSAFEKITFSNAYMKHGALSWGTNPIDDEYARILQRFATVFEQTYTRFLDLQKAETQAEEAKIEAALERTRTQSMIMQHSSELDNTLRVFHEQVQLLGIHSEFSFLWLPDEGKEQHLFWAVWTEEENGSKIYKSKAINYRLDRNDPATAQCLVDWKSDETIHSYEVTPEGVENYFAAWTELFDGAEKLTPEHFANGLNYVEAYMKYGCFGVMLENDLNRDEKKTLGRFATEFERTYTRFLDLQKAEAQAREAQIELSLERVRAMTMAMRTTTDLSAIIGKIYQELTSLDVLLDRCFIMVFDENLQGVSWWTASRENQSLPHGYFVQHHEHEPNLAYYNAWKEKKEKWTYILEGDTKRKWDTFLFSQTELKDLPEPVKSGMKAVQTAFITGSFSAFGCLTTGTHQPLSESQMDLLLRFTKVFDQTYTRFLDLQKAEAQARESQIQLALERVRARTMAMQHSDELQEASNLLFLQVQALGIPAWSCGYNVWEKDEKICTGWMCSEGMFQPPFKIPLTENPTFVRFYESRQKGEIFYVEEVGGEALVKHYQYMLSLPDFAAIASHHITAGYALPSYQINHVANFAQGNLIFITNTPVPEAHDVFKRFAKVFDQTYTRFLDLQKAEAQAKEATIEASLERVRSRSMAMHKSEEVKEVAHTLYTELQKLGFTYGASTIIIMNDKTGDMEHWVGGFEQGKYPTSYFVNYFDNPCYKAQLDAWKNGEKFLVYELIGEEKEQYDENMFTKTDYQYFPDKEKKWMRQTSSVMFSLAYMKHGAIHWGPSELSNEQSKILQRFANVFEQTYTRFLDLQKAEAQAREAKIEAALESVRASSMAMHHSDELEKVVKTLSDKLIDLGLSLDGTLIFFFEKEERSINLWIATNHLPAPIKVKLPYNEAIQHNPIIKNLWQAIETGGDFANQSYTGEVKDDYFRFVAIHNESKIPEEVRKLQLEAESWSISFIGEKNSIVGIDSWSGKVTTPEEFQVLKRFAKVFEQAYTRFLDLQKAEAQAREAQIEASLERVRSRAMAMHSSEDVTLATETMFNELQKFGFDNLRCGIANIHLNKTFDVFGVTNLKSGNTMSGFGSFGMNEHPIWQRWFESWNNKEEVFIAYIAGQEKEEYFNNINNHRDYLPQQIVQFPDNFFQAYHFDQGAVWVYSLIEHSKPEREIMKRFVTVFSLTFRRYQDLKKAEAQAREATIESSLERVRARTMAMHSSDDVSTATATMFTELEKLGIENVRGGIANIRNDQTQEVWSVNNTDDGKIVRGVGVFDMTVHPFWRALFKGWDNKEEFLYYFLAGEEKEDYVKILNSSPNYLNQPIQQFPDMNIQAYHYGEGAVWTFSLQPHSEQEKQVMKRFASVFSLTFRRYQDLKKAETQAREAHIEAALERVRSRAMAMQKPGELIEVAELLRKEMGLLGVEELETSSIYIHDEASATTECWYAIQDIRGEDKQLVTDHMTIHLNNTWVGREMMKFYMSGQKQTSILMQGENRKEWINYCAQHSKVFAEGYYGDTIPERTYHLLKFSNGYMGAASPGDLSAESWELLKRATNVFSLAYTRFSDLQIAETSAKEAVKQSALDRIRADIASMRTNIDLDRITPLIWSELTILCVPFIRCGVFIMDDSQELIHTFLSTPDGKAIAAFHLPYDTPGNLSKVLSHWRDHQNYIDHWDESAFTDLAEVLVKQGAIASPGQYLNTIPGGGFYLHFFPFLQGMLYVGNTEQLMEEDIQLIQSVADAFSTAYARYEDFNRLEVAKQQVDKTLVELKQAQAQLVQSEKMASLGELTAGIAHEIQNPLNFVNNFSEVSTELLDEMIAELGNGNKEDAIAIADDVKQNLEKILHHGKRADGIVKGMLQHSRSSTAVREPTDINKLADEYLRLAYHGLRAKDKSFNATLNTDFDESIGSINVISQDIGRAVLNLITNAFYAASLPSKGGFPDSDKIHDPTIWVSTKKVGDEVLITVKDNGPGIPGKIVDKIFQPFFTTKPTGQGTGLGLSLSYDIIKAHGGEIKVETKEGEGSIFIILLPEKGN